MPNHNTSKCNSYTSAKDLGWSISALVQRFVRKDKAETARRMKAEGFRHSQIARLMYGEANTNTISKVSKLLKEDA